MKPVLFQNQLIVKPSPVHGYGVFADKKINIGEVVEDCYVLFCNDGDPVLANYIFDADGENGLLLGYGSIYNHSQDPNARYDFKTKVQIATIVAIKPIEKGEEIFISYGDDWFASRGIKAKKTSAWRRWLNPRTSILIRGGFVSALVFGSVHLIKALLSQG